MSTILNTNEAPFPNELDDLVAHCQYRPGWQVGLHHLDRGQGSVGLTLVVTTNTIDTYNPEQPIRVNHYFPVPPAAYDRRSWQRWLFEQFLLVERHECAEFFQIVKIPSYLGRDGNQHEIIERPYAPSHGPGNDPYLIREVGTELDRKTNFRGEVST